MNQAATEYSLIAKVRALAASDPDVKDWIDQCFTEICELALKRRDFDAVQAAAQLKVLLTPGEGQGEQSPPPAQPLALEPAAERVEAEVVEDHPVHTSFFRTETWRQRFREAIHDQLTGTAMVRGGRAMMSAMELFSTIEAPWLENGSLQVMPANRYIGQSKNIHKETRPWRIAMSETLQTMVADGLVEQVNRSYRLSHSERQKINRA
jgi:hypothetical protein